MSTFDRASLFALACVAATGCGTGVEPDAQLTDGSGIVYGSRQPSVVSLSAGQRLAVGAVLVGPEWDRDNTCTGTLVSPTLVATAAHCVEGLGRASLAFAVGADASRPLEVATPSAVAMHPDYDPEGDARHDFAVLRFAEPFTRAEPIPVNCNRAETARLVGSRIQVAGYGETEDDEWNTLQWWAPGRVTSATSYDLTVAGDGRGVCDGDSGGPALAALSTGAVHVVATLSWGEDCGVRDHFARTDDNCAFLATISGASSTPAPGGGTTVEGVTFTAAQAAATLSLVNTASLTTLDDAVGLDSRAARGIVAARPFATLEALAAVPYVGTSALTKLRDFAK